MALIRFSSFIKELIENDLVFCGRNAEFVQVCNRCVKDFITVIKKDFIVLFVLLRLICRITFKH